MHADTVYVYFTHKIDTGPSKEGRSSENVKSYGKHTGFKQSSWHRADPSVTLTVSTSFGLLALVMKCVGGCGGGACDT